MFYRCNVCGNIVGLVNNGGGELVCCGKPMEELVAKTVDQGKEKHLPVVQLENGKLFVRVGEIPHPMTEEHLIEWVAIRYNNKTQRARLSYTDKPEVYFDVNEEFDEMEVYEYCNIHGLWKTIYKK